MEFGVHLRDAALLRGEVNAYNAEETARDRLLAVNLIYRD
jgi:hypothetical protein